MTDTDRTKAVAEAWNTEREAFARIIRWRAIYERARSRMERMHPSTAARFHHRLKACEYTAIEAHQAAEQWLRAIGGAALSVREGRA
jgi:hypothetical protein